MINSIAKGKRFEREVAKILTEKTKVKWMRVAMSGAFATKQQIQNNVFRGDVFTESDEYCDIVVECKYRKRPILFSEIFFDYQNMLAGFLTQAINESNGADFSLFIKTNHSHIIIFSNSKKIKKIFNLKLRIIFKNKKIYFGKF